MQMNVDIHGILNRVNGGFIAEDMIGKSIALLGIPDSGKSNTAAVLMEELLSAGIPICVVDPAGEYHTLKDKYTHVYVNAPETFERRSFLNESNRHLVIRSPRWNFNQLVITSRVICYE